MTVHRFIVLSGCFGAGGYIPSSALVPLADLVPIQQPLSRNTNPLSCLPSLIFSHGCSSHPPRYHSDRLSFVFQCTDTYHRTEPNLSLVASFHPSSSLVSLVDA
ncbi:hypothetical protein BDM02DRAFT_3108709 [Thelephora ganbajun]|uniref:Uncharacterized protein n=1 Tax=Thelephora ganbajun TaxID=370292 RepID=A0ACB6ZSL7_THEGA|nr:hypothetical protein BDM02DRAFT_3108709 [Thelephora ganbajun]